jgi:hypothetical protein
VEEKGNELIASKDFVNTPAPYSSAETGLWKTFQVHIDGGDWIDPVKRQAKAVAGRLPL